MAANVAQLALEAVTDYMVSLDMWSVLFELALFGCGFAVISALLNSGYLSFALPGLAARHGPVAHGEGKGRNLRQQRLRCQRLRKEMELAAASGPESVRDLWLREKSKGPFPVATFQNLVNGLLASSSGTATVDEIVEHIVVHTLNDPDERVTSEIVAAFQKADTVRDGTSDGSQLGRDFERKLTEQLKARNASRTAGPRAATGDERAPGESPRSPRSPRTPGTQSQSQSRKPFGGGGGRSARNSPCSCSGSALPAQFKALLQEKDLAGASEELLSTSSKGSEAFRASFLALLKAAAGSGRESLLQTLDKLESRVRGAEQQPSSSTAAAAAPGTGTGTCTSPSTSADNLSLEFPQECLAWLLNEALSAEDVELTERVDGIYQRQEMPTHYSIYEPLLKTYAKACNPRALAIFQELQDQGFLASEGFCGTLLARCGEGRNIELAQVIAEYCKRRQIFSLAIFRTMMKAYACCSRYDLACDLYQDVVAAGLEPDSIMYGCLLKYAVKCERRTLTEELFQRSGRKTLQDFLWLIRAAGHDDDPDRAQSLFQEAIEEGFHDATLYNCMLDILVSGNRGEAAHQHLAAAKTAGVANLVTFNTIMKLHCSKGDFAASRRTMAEISEWGFTPDCATYNCLLGGAVDFGKFSRAWEIVDDMKAAGIKHDNYTISTLMKLAKKATDQREAERALRVLDQVDHFQIVQDEVLLNAVLDTCIQRRHYDHLRRVLEASEKASLEPSVQTYGVMIKGWSTLRQTSKCRALWKHMTEVQGLAPKSITLSCMLDALILAQQLHEEALPLFRKWQHTVEPNIVTYGVLIKGCGMIGDCKQAVELYDELKAAGLAMNLMSFGALINAHAKAGLMVQANKFLQEMISSGCPPNVITYSAMVKGYCIKGDLESAFEILGTMVNEGLKPDTVLFNTLLDGCVRHSRFQLAEYLIDEMDKDGIEPSAFTLSIVVKLWGKRGNIEKAFDFVRGVARQGLPAFDMQVATSLVAAAFANSSPSLALSVLGEMKSWPTSRLGGGKGGGGGGASRCSSSSGGGDGLGLAPDAALLGPLLTGLLSAGAVTEAFKVGKLAFELGVEGGIYENTWRALLRSLAYEKHHEEWAELKALITNSTRLPEARVFSGQEDASDRHHHQAKFSSRYDQTNDNNNSNISNSNARSFHSPNNKPYAAYAGKSSGSFGRGSRHDHASRELAESGRFSCH